MSKKFKTTKSVHETNADLQKFWKNKDNILRFQHNVNCVRNFTYILENAMDALFTELIKLTYIPNECISNTIGDSFNEFIDRLKKSYGVEIVRTCKAK